MFDPVLFAALMGSTALFSPSSLFSAGEQGAWYDPSDFSTMFQDAAGTTPVTAVEQPVGKILDKSGRGNHASQSTSASRPVLSARVNLLTYSEQFDNAAWTVSGCTRSSNTGVAPDGTTTADTITGSTGTNAVIYNTSGVSVSAGNHTFTFHIKAGTAAFAVISLWAGSGSNGVNVWVNVQTGEISSNSATAGYSFVSATSTSVGDGWYRITLVGTVPAVTIYTSARIVDSDGTFVYTNTVGDTLQIWGADLRVTNDGVGIPDYQRVAAATDYDTSGFPLYLKFDGTDDSLATASVDFSATDKMSVFAGVRKLSDAANGAVVDLNSAAGVGAFLLRAPNGAAANYGVFSGADAANFRSVTAPSNYTSPITNLITGLADIAADSIVVRVNAAQVATSALNQGVGNYSNNQLFVGVSSSSSARFNGRLYSLIVRGAQSTDAQIASTETWVDGKTGAY